MTSKNYNALLQKVINGDQSRGGPQCGKLKSLAVHSERHRGTRAIETSHNDEPGRAPRGVSESHSEVR